MAYGREGAARLAALARRRGRGGPAPGRARPAPSPSSRRPRPPCVPCGPGPPGTSASWSAAAWRRWPCRAPGSRCGWRPRGPGSRWSWPSGPTWASRCSRSPAPRRAGNWPGPCWPSGSSALGGPQTMVFDEVDAGVGRCGRPGAGRGPPRGGRRPPGAGRHPPGPGGVAGRRADQRGQARGPGPHRHQRHHGRRARTASRSCRACSRGTRAATPPARTPASCSAHRPGGSPPRVPVAFDYRGRVHRSPEAMRGVPKAA